MDLERIRNIAKLAKLEFSDDELKAFAEDFERILEFVGEIDKLDLEGVEPLYAAGERKAELRKDAKGKSLNHDDALKNAPRKDDGYIGSE